MMISPFLTYDEDKKAVFNWLEGNYVIEEDSGHPFFKLFRGEKIKADEIARYIDDFNWLKKNHFLLDSELEAQKLIDQLYSYLNRDSLLQLVLLPAGLDCNFECKYCYQNRDNHYYGIDHQKRLIKLFSHKKGLKEVSLSFFGGEPLLNSRWIIDFLQNVKKEFPHIKLTSTITTNGYLLEKKIFLKLLALGVNTYQITLDGVEETHNFLRPLENGAPTFKKIVENLNNISALNGEFRIVLRINYNNSFNFDHWLKWVKREPFSRDKRFFYIFRPIASGWNEKVNDVACKQSKKYERFRFNSLLLENGLISFDYLFYKKGGLLCPAGRKNFFILNWDFSLSKCTVEMDNPINRVGYLTSGGVIHLNRNANLWVKKPVAEEKCRKCFFLPLCLSNHCPLNNIKYQTSICPVDKSYAVEIQRQIVHFLEKTE